MPCNTSFLTEQILLDFIIMCSVNYSSERIDIAASLESELIQKLEVRERDKVQMDIKKVRSSALRLNE